MKRLHTYSAWVFLALLLFPLVKNSVHELSHLKETHCDVHEKHYCAVEHNCRLCDFVFASSLLPPSVNSQAVFSALLSEDVLAIPVPFLSGQDKYTFSLRGPPVG